MTTTALFVELLVSGVQSMLWIGVLMLIGCDPHRLIAVVTQHSVGSSVILLALAYSLGIVFDRVWDAMLNPIDKHIRAKTFPDAEQVHRVRALLFSSDPVRAQFVDYIRGRIRITRSTVCNAMMIVLSAGIVACVHWDSSWVCWLVCGAVFSAVIAGVALYAHYKVIGTYYKTLKRFELHVTENH